MGKRNRKFSKLDAQLKWAEWIRAITLSADMLGDLVSSEHFGDDEMLNLCQFLSQRIAGKAVAMHCSLKRYRRIQEKPA